MRLLYAILAERVHANAIGQLIIDGTIEVAIPDGEPPFRPPGFYVAGAIIADHPADLVHSLDVIIPHPDGGEPILHYNALPNLAFTEAIGVNGTLGYLARFSIRLPQMIFPSLGGFDFEIHVDGVKLGAASLFIANSPKPGLHSRSNVGPREADKELSVAKALAQTREVLNNARIALDDLVRGADARRRMAGFSNVVVWGRSVTLALQRLRSRVEGFDEWYEPWKQEMASDPLLRYFGKWRNELLKRGSPPPITESTDLRKALQHGIVATPPSGALGFFSGDETGGIGWLVRMPDGSIGKVYIEVPEGVLANAFNISDLPETHLGAPIVDRSADQVARMYVHYLERLVATAERDFGNHASVDMNS